MTTETALLTSITSAHPQVPPEAALAFWDSEPTTADTMYDGLVNQTYRVAHGSTDAIMQRLSPVVPAATMANSVAVMRHMKGHGWEVPTPLTTHAGEYVHTDQSGFLWRAMTYVDNDGRVPEALDDLTAYQAGELLGAWHRSLADSTYQPVETLPHFHDTPHHAARLQERLAAMPDDETRAAGRLALSVFMETPALEPTDHQLIHGDPKLANMLFRDGSPFTLIDYDTHMRGSVWLDVGDLLRSICSYDIGNGQAPSAERLQVVLQGYQHGSEIEMPTAELNRTGLAATRIIALELTMRYLSDIVDQSYFSWDMGRADSHRDYLYGRAGTQWHIVQALHGRL